MKLKKVLTILVASIMILSCNVGYAEEIEQNNIIVQSQEEFMQSEEYRLMKQEIENIKQEILNDIENNRVSTFANVPINPMGLANIDPIANPVSDNWLTQEIAKQVKKSNVNQLTQEDFNKILSITVGEKQLKDIPKEIGNLFNLSYLSLYENQITEIPTEIGNLVSLETLILYANKITKVPIEIGNLVNLTTLYLNGNQIEEISPEICNLVNLTFLSLNDNQIKEIPSNIGNLVNLNVLSLDENQIKKIPSNMDSLTKLRFLTLHINQIAEIPFELFNLSVLQKLYLNNQKVDLSNKFIQPNKNFSIINPINALNEHVTPINISNAGVYNTNVNNITWLSSDIAREESFSFHKSITIGTATNIFSGTVNQPTTIGEEESIAITFPDETVNNHVYSNEVVSIPIILKGSGDYYALDTTIEYDSELLEFKDYSIKNGFKDYYVSNEDNILRYILASQGKDNPINSSADKIMYLNFTTLKVGEANIKITDGKIANLEEEINVENLGNIILTIEDKNTEPEVPKDINRDDKFNLTDLAIDAYYYGMNFDDTDKTKYDADIIPDGKIDDADLQEIVKQILGTK